MALAMSPEELPEECGPAVLRDASLVPAVVLEGLGGNAIGLSGIRFVRAPDGSIGLWPDELRKLAEVAAGGAMVWFMPGVDFCASVATVPGEESVLLAPRATLSAGPIAVNMNEKRAFMDGEQLELPAREYELLEFFMQNPGRAHRREEIIAAVWGQEYLYAGGHRTVDVHIRRIRRRIKDETCSIIEAVRRVGYRFNLEVVTEQPSKQAR